MRNNNENDSNKRVSTLARRDLIKLGVGAGAAAAGMLKAPAIFAQQAQQPPPAPTGGLDQPPSLRVQHFPDITESQEVITTVQPGYITKTGPGWVNNSGRAFGNGPMDECSRRIVEWVHGFSESDLTPSCLETINFLQHDTVGSLFGGFESEPARINARLSQTMRGPCTVMGYGIKTTYEMAAFSNAAMIRHTDLAAFSPSAKRYTPPARRCSPPWPSATKSSRPSETPDRVITTLPAGIALTTASAWPWPAESSWA